MDCLVRDISPTGAKLELDGTSVLPCEFDLAVPQRRTVHPCEIRWRRQNAVGVRFKENIDPAKAQYGEFAKAEANSRKARDGAHDQ